MTPLAPSVFTGVRTALLFQQAPPLTDPCSPSCAALAAGGTQLTMCASMTLSQLAELRPAPAH